MGQFEVYNSFPGEFTFISNHFLDRYMPSANGEFVKIYLYLLRHASGKGTALNLSSIADAFNCTEADVLRALRYWKKTGILDVTFDNKGTLTRVIFYPIASSEESFGQNSLQEAAAGLETPKETFSPSSSTLTPDKIRALKGNDEVRQLLFIAEQYLGKTLTPTDMETLLFLYDEVGLSAELMEYLIEYCVSKGSTSMAYIKKVGLAWAEQKIVTVNQAKEETNLYNRNYFTILRAFGIKNRNPLEKEIQYMNLWMKGEPEREVFTALAPMTEGLSRTPGMPYNIKEHRKSQFFLCGQYLRKLVQKGSSPSFRYRFPGSEFSAEKGCQSSRFQTSANTDEKQIQ